MGRPRRPERLKVLNGTSRRDRQRVEPEPAPTEPSCPSWLTPVQKRYWHWVEGELPAMRLWHSADTAAVINVAIAMSTLELCNKAIATDGLLVEGQKGNMVRNPSVVLRTQTQALLRTLLRELGLSPLGRAQLPAPPPVKDPLSPERLLTSPVDRSPGRLLG